jgi:hypothetical protein
MKKLLVVILAMTVFVSGCAIKSGHVNHPNAVSAFDSDAYDTLLGAQAAIEEAKSNIAAHPDAKDALNATIKVYNLAEAAEKTYHASQDAAAYADLQKALPELISAVATLEQLFGKKLGVKP